MKPHVRNKTPYVFPLRSRNQRPANRLLETILRMTSELGNLQAEICSTAGGPAEVLNNFSLRERDAAHLALSDFRLALDQLRYMLWMSLEMPETADDPAKSQQQPRQSNGETALSAPPLPERPSALPPTSASFFDRLDVVIEAYMKNNAPAEAGASRRPKS